MTQQNTITNILFAGLGGQGVLKASDICAEAAFRAGLDVKKSELHGMSQRGGSVTSDVRFGKAVYSPMIPEGEADILVVLEDTQLAPNQHQLRENGIQILPDAVDASQLENKKSLNVALLGVLSAHLDIPEQCWLDALHANLAEKLHAMNDKAFALGHASAKKA
jgi:indolepyruvate ferredoxin oxidoreductase, beta subunit